MPHITSKNLGREGGPCAFVIIKEHQAKQLYCEPPTTSIRSIWQNNLVCKELVAVQTCQHNSPLNIHQGSNMFIQISTLKAICLIRSAGPILPNSEILDTSKKTKFIELLLECGPKMLAICQNMESEM